MGRLLETLLNLTANTTEEENVLNGNENNDVTTPEYKQSLEPIIPEWKLD